MHRALQIREYELMCADQAGMAAEDRLSMWSERLYREQLRQRQLLAAAAFQPFQPYFVEDGAAACTRCPCCRATTLSSCCGAHMPIRSLLSVCCVWGVCFFFPYASADPLLAPGIGPTVLDAIDSGAALTALNRLRTAAVLTSPGPSSPTRTSAPGSTGALRRSSSSFHRDEGTPGVPVSVSGAVLVTPVRGSASLSGHGGLGSASGGAASGGGSLSVGGASPSPGLATPQAASGTSGSVVLEGDAYNLSTSAMSKRFRSLLGLPAPLKATGAVALAPVLPPAVPTHGGAALAGGAGEGTSASASAATVGASRKLRALGGGAPGTTSATPPRSHGTVTALRHGSSASPGDGSRVTGTATGGVGGGGHGMSPGGGSGGGSASGGPLPMAIRAPARVPGLGVKGVPAATVPRPQV